MKVLIKRIDKDLPLPKYETAGAAAFDIMAREDMSIEAGQIGLIPGNVIVKVPDGYMLVLVPRSSTPRKKGLSIPHGIGIIDMDYHGPEDELKVQVLNFTKESVLVSRGERIAQAVFVKIDKFEFEEVEQIAEKSRGGFGSTG
jgi:dUTP pyrophosphatase